MKEKKEKEGKNMNERKRWRKRKKRKKGKENELNHKFTVKINFMFYLKGVLLRRKLPCKTSSQKIFIVVEWVPP